MRTEPAFILMASLFALPVSAAPLCESAERLPSMGTVFEIQMVGPCERSEVLKETQTRLDAIESSMSLYQKESEISRLNRGETVSPSRDFLEVVQLALEHGARTNGYFDITVWPALSLIQKTLREQGKPPSDMKLAELRSGVDYHHVKTESGRLSFDRPGTQITTDGIAKGYAVDEIAKLLNSRGIPSFLINFSGNMRVQGSHPDGKPWSVAIFNPVSRKTLPIQLGSGQSIASSGIDFASYSKDRKWHHLIDPKTLKPANHVIGTTVMGPSAATCDVLSTATFVMGPNLASRIMAKNYPEYRYWMVDASNRIFTNINERKP